VDGIERPTHDPQPAALFLHDLSAYLSGMRSPDRAVSCASGEAFRSRQPGRSGKKDPWMICRSD